MILVKTRFESALFHASFGNAFLSFLSSCAFIGVKSRGEGWGERRRRRGGSPVRGARGCAQEENSKVDEFERYDHYLFHLLVFVLCKLSVHKLSHGSHCGCMRKFVLCA